MNTAPTLNMQFTYNQLLMLALQLADEDRFMLCRELTQGIRTDSLKQLRDIFRTDELDEETILAECEAVRQELYEERKAGNNG